MNNRAGTLNLLLRTFGRLKVIGKEELSYKNQVMWLCECACGGSKSVATGRLTSGRTRSCGCINKERFITHGQAFKGKKSTEYNIWHNMRARCSSPKNSHYSDYGGRGITVCKEWQESFEAFFSDMGERPMGLELDRTDNNKGYSPDNCRWATRTQQTRNRRGNVPVEYKGIKYTSVAELAESTGVTYLTLLSRINAGWPVHEAVTQPKMVGIHLKTRHQEVPL